MTMNVCVSVACLVGQVSAFVYCPCLLSFALRLALRLHTSTRPRTMRRSRLNFIVRFTCGGVMSYLPRCLLSASLVVVVGPALCRQ